MAFHLLCGGSKISYGEKQILDRIIADLMTYYANSKEYCYLFVGYENDLKQVDATLIRSSAIINIEIKNYSDKRAIVDAQGRVSLQPSLRHVSPGRQSPLDQVKQQNFGLKNFIFKNQKALFGAVTTRVFASPDNINIGGFIVFASVQQIDTSLLPPRFKSFIRFTDSRNFLRESLNYSGRDPVDSSKPLDLEEGFVIKLSSLLALQPVSSLDQEHPLPHDVEAPLKAYLQEVSQSFKLSQYVTRPDLERALLERGNTIIVGAPGAGKSTLLERIVSHFAAECLKSLSTSPIPCLLRLVGSETDIVRSLSAEIGIVETEVNEVRQMLAEGRFHIVFDAVDEMVRFRENLPKVLDFVRLYPRNIYSISTRREYFAEYREEFKKLKKFKELSVEQFKPDEKERYFHLKLDEQFYNEHIEAIRLFAESLPDANPLTLEMALEILRQSKRPIYENQGRFYEEFFRLRLQKEVKKAKELGRGSDLLLRDILTALAGTAFEQGSKYFLIEDVLGLFRDQADADQTKYYDLLLRAEILDKVRLEVTRGKDVRNEDGLQFHHFAYRDYFVASSMIGKLRDEELSNKIISHSNEHNSLVLLCGIERDTSIVDRIINTALENQKLLLAVDCFCNTENVSFEVIEKVTDMLKDQFQRSDDGRAFVFQTIWTFRARACGATLYQFLENQTETNILWKIDWEILKWKRLGFEQTHDACLNTFRAAKLINEGPRDSEMDGVVLGKYSGLSGCEEAQNALGFQLYHKLINASTNQECLELALDTQYPPKVRAFILMELLDFSDKAITNSLFDELQRRRLLFSDHTEEYLWITIGILIPWMELRPDNTTINELFKLFWAVANPNVQLRVVFCLPSPTAEQLVETLHFLESVLNEYTCAEQVDKFHIYDLLQFGVLGTGEMPFMCDEEIAGPLWISDFHGGPFDVLIKCVVVTKLLEFDHPVSKQLMLRYSFSEDEKLRNVATWCLDQLKEKQSTTENSL